MMNRSYKNFLNTEVELMKSIQLFILSVLVLTLSSCVADSKTTKKKTASTSTSTTPTDTTPNFGTDAMYWFSTEKITGTITVNKSSQNVIYLRGSNIHNFLNSKNPAGAYNYAKQFCLVGKFSSTAYKQLRVKAVPISITNFETRKIERLFRVDLPASDENSESCMNTASEAVLPSTFANGIANICVDPNSLSCRGFVSTSSFQLYESAPKINTASLVASNRLDVTTLQIKIDLLSSSSDNSTSCTNSACSAKGFDCCIEGQCVKDATERPNLDASNPEVITARQEFQSNPLSFLNYPNVYFICTNINRTPLPSDNDSTTSPTDEARLRVQNYLPKWKCMNHYELNSGSSNQYDLCTDSDTLTSNESTYNKTKIEVAKLCGCSASDENIESACPNWKLKPVYKSTVESDANIVDFVCLTPTPESPVGPIVNLNVNVSARTAPHRFFYLNQYKNQTNLTPKTFAYDTKKQSYSDFVYTQEGDSFSYIDEFTKTGPISGSYNVNSLLGSMNVDLTRTHPAKSVTVELGRTYILSATSGYFTPCTRCAKDSWYESFTAYPSTQKGIGLTARGYTTKRDEFGANSTLGNYEDTIFGRACWLPVTMIPFSHVKKATPNSTTTDPTIQRQERLKTQAAFYINGYQRDWYGFNKGALIGSFDGVQWFAIGTGRRLTATSNKLFLAMNGSFFDLADATDTVVNIIPDLGGNTAPSYDYDPELAFNDPQQNSAASCQRFHQCNTDSDCVTQLGWEYTCSDVSQVKTKWPNFNADAEEIGNSEKETYLADILSANQPTNVAKRCVYRGMGALCRRDFSAITNTAVKSMFTCAPNFTCVSLNSNRFNEEVIRSPNELDQVLYGKDANILGRPKDYVTSTKALPQTAINNIQANGFASVNATDFGLCMPGKAITGHSLYNHQNTDSLRRTDFTSQIGTCNSSVQTTEALNKARYYACPLFGEDMNYVLTTNGADLGTNLNNILNQNACGGESRDSVTGDSAFKSIEFASLSVSKSVITPGFAADACFRRAGSVCHTDLDCSPNKLHADLLTTLGIKFFGNTKAEYKYWEESLVCGQGEAVPTIGAANYLDYDIKENRCCREIGKDFTMFSSDKSATKGIIVPDLGSENYSLDTSLMSYANPKTNFRYSRYAVSKTALATSTSIPSVTSTTYPNADQWKVINETGSATCCGGGWVRKFSDGTHDWKVNNRLKLPAENFQCLNYRSKLSDPGLQNPSNAHYTVDGFNFQSYIREYDYFCRAPRAAASTNNLSPTSEATAEGASAFGCLQAPFADLDDGYDVTPPYRFGPRTIHEKDPWYSTVGALASERYVRINTTPSPDAYEAGELEQYLSTETPYMPIPFQSNENKEVRQNFLYMVNSTGYRDVVVANYLPTYVPYRNSYAMAPLGGGEINPVGPVIKDVHFIVNYTDNANQEFDIRYRDTITSRVLNRTDCQATYNYLKAGTFTVPGLEAVMNNYTTVGYRGVDGAITHDATNTRSPLADGISPRTDGVYAVWCVAREDSTNRPILLVISTLDYDDRIQSGGYYYFNYAGYALDFVPHEGDANPRLHAGNQNYYLTKLARLELLGIPQITYEPVYCTNSQSGSTLNKLVPGIFKTSNADPLTTKTHVEAKFPTYPGAYSDTLYDSTSPLDSFGNNTKRFTYQNNVDHPQIFSGHEFACCTPLGKTPTSADKCCTGYAKEDDNGKLTCMIPKGTDLNVYFNKFVSGEGIGESLPEGGLITEGTAEEVDFIPQTGEVKLRATSYNKLIAIGNAFCDGELVKGGAFGYFPPEPFAGGYAPEEKFPLSIVDSDVDFESEDETVGKSAYDQGFKWNHHIYCK